MNRIAFETPTVCRVGPIAAVAGLMGVGLFTAVMVLGLRAVWNLYTLLPLAAMVVLLVLYWARLPWLLRLESHSVWIGATRHGHWVTYENIRFLALADASSAAAGTVARLTIETDQHRYAIELRPGDAGKALSELRERSRHASGVTIDGDAFLASDTADREPGARRVVQVLVWRAIGWGVPGLFGLGAMVLIGKDRLLAHPTRLISLCILVALAFVNAAQALVRAGQPAQVPGARSARPE
jgi:hypothetical protein